MTSKFNDDKAFAKDGNKNHPRGRDMPHFEIRQIIMGDPEVFTNLDFIQIPTLPFELQPTNGIIIDSNGNVCSNQLSDAHPQDDLLVECQCNKSAFK